MRPFTRLSVPATILDEVIAHAREALPNECCGLLAGRIENGTGIAATRFTIGNDLASPTAYQTNARDLFAAFRAMRSSGVDLLAIYHSHPASEAVPSRRDLAENTYGECVVHLIIGLARQVVQVKAWWLGPTDFCEADLAVGTIDL